jgi:Zn-dependent peptidase ImmA (M78 family)/DNA-binding XRE family transcriptional regulator
MSLAEQLLQARSRVGYSQEDAANALGISRTMLSYWESGKREPNARHLTALARLYRVDLDALVSGGDLSPEGDLAAMLFRGADEELLPQARSGMREWVDFLDTYAELARAASFHIRGMKQSPFTLTAGFDGVEDARRKAEEVRSHLRLGLGPIGDLDAVCELLGITVFRTRLGADLTQTISGAFFNHPEVGFSLLVNLDMTPGRRRFTVAHELAHALFHTASEQYVLSLAHKNPREKFADSFAGEFLMPTEGIRRVMEEHSIGPRIDDPADVIYLQRYFGVSYVTALVRLRQAHFLPQKCYEAFKSVRPVVLARALGYEIDNGEYRADHDAWRIRRFPHRFLRLLRLAITKEIISIPTAANLTDLSIDEIADLLGEQEAAGELADENEIREFEETGIPA